MIFSKKKQNLQIKDFDVNAFIEANKDNVEVQKNQNNIIKSFKKTWIEKIQKGELKFHPNFEPFDEDKYLNLFKDVFKAVREGKFATGFEHFCRFGYVEIINYQRKWIEYIEIKMIPKDIFKNFVFNSTIKVNKIVCFDLDGFFNTDFEKFLQNNNTFKPYLSEYIDLIAMSNIHNGISKFHKDYAPFNEKKYLSIHTDLKPLVEDGTFQSAYEHFYKYGYREIITGTRFWPKDSRNQNVELLRLVNFKNMIEE